MLDCFQHIDTFAAKVYVSVSPKLPSEVTAREAHLFDLESFF